MNPNYSYLYNNLSPEIKKYTNIYRSLSPVVIKTYGVNNFVYERKYKTKTNNDIYDPEYDYIESELKKSKGIKGHTAYTELSTQENMSLFSNQIKKPTKRYYKNKTNINDEREYCLCKDNDISFFKEKRDNKTRTYIGNDNNFKNKILKKDELNEILYQNEQLHNNQNYKKYKQNKNKTELITQSFSTSIIPEKKSLNDNKSNNIFEIKYVKKKNSFQNKEIEIKRQNNSYTNSKKYSSYSKSRINLEDFNIDKLKEIGDDFAMRYLNNNGKINNNKYENNLNNDKNIFKKENKIIKNLMIIEEKRKHFKDKSNLLLKSSDDIQNKQKNIFSIENKNKIKTPNKHDIINLNIKHNYRKNKIKIINIDKKNATNIKQDSPPPKIIKIKLKHKIMGKECDYFLNKSNNNNERRIIYYHNVNNINNIINNNIERRVNYRFFPNKGKKSPKTPDNKKVNNPKIFQGNKYNNNRKIINLNEKYKKFDLYNINHCYLESININKASKASKTKHSFKDIFLPSQCS